MLITGMNTNTSNFSFDVFYAEVMEIGSLGSFKNYCLVRGVWVRVPPSVHNKHRYSLTVERLSHKELIRIRLSLSVQFALLSSQ